MKRMCKFVYVLCLLCTALAVVSCGSDGVSEERSRYYAMLDSTLQHVQDYERTLLAKLADMKQKASVTQSLEARFFYNKLIAESYYYYIPDSAMVYIDRNREMADRYGRDDWRAETEINRALMQILQGLLSDARKTLDSVRDMPMTRENRMNYYVDEIKYWNYFALFRGLQQPHANSIAAADSLTALVGDSNSPYVMYAGMYSTAEANADNDTSRNPDFLDRLTDYIDHMDEDDLWYGSLAENAGVLASVVGDKDRQVKYCVLGLCYDIKHVSRHLLMLPSVARLALDDGELAYATDFYDITLKVQQDYPERVHNSNGGLQTNMMHYHQVMMEQVESQKRTADVMVVVCSALAVMAMASAMYNIKQSRRKSLLNRELRSNMQQLRESHDEMGLLLDTLKQKDSELRLKNTELEQYNQMLGEANYVKEEYIGRMFATCSEYLEKMSKLCQTINRKLRAGQYEDAMRATEAKDVRENAELQELWNRFDDVFLGLFPDFVEQFNSLLQPDKRITLRQGERMNTNLRIYALVRLGISSSAKIGRILGISSQTVYNATMKIRGCAKEEYGTDFNAAVRQLKGIKTDRTA